MGVCFQRNEGLLPPSLKQHAAKRFSSRHSDWATSMAPWWQKVELKREEYVNYATYMCHPQ
jgi:hypothetical protein